MNFMNNVTLPQQILVDKWGAYITSLYCVRDCICEPGIHKSPLMIADVKAISKSMLKM